MPSNSLCAIEICDQKVDIISVPHLAQKTISTVASKLKGKGSNAIIGPAAENQVLFSNIIVGELAGSMELDLSYGEVEARKVAFNFSTIDLVAKSADIDLVFSPRSFITVDIEGKEENMYLPLEFENLDKSYADSRKIAKVRGKVGKANNYPAILNIQSTGGDINITQETDETSSANLPEN